MSTRAERTPVRLRHLPRVPEQPPEPECTSRHFVVVTAVYPPEPVTSARTSAEIAGALAALNDRVTVLAPFPNRPGGRVQPPFRRRLYQAARERDVTVIRCFSLLSTRSTLASRLAENISFGLTSALRLAIMPKPHAVYSNTWPILASGMIALIARMRGIPLVFAVQDLYPESLIAQGRVTEGSVVARWLRNLDGRIIRTASSVVAISSRFADIMVRSRGIAAARIAVVPNWGTQLPPPQVEEIERLRAGLNPDGAQLAVFGGNIGAAAGVDRVIEAARLLSSTNIRIVIAGEGTELGAIRRLAQLHGITNVVFHTPWLPHETAALLALADVLVLPTAPGQAKASVPSKLITYMFAGKPIVAVADPDSDVADILRESGAGWCVEPSSPDELARCLELALAAPTELREVRGSAGRRFASERYTAEVCVHSIVNRIRTACRDTGGAA